MTNNRKDSVSFGFVELGVGDLVLNALVYVVASLLVYVVVNRRRQVAVDWDQNVSVDDGLKIRLGFLDMSCSIPDLQRRHRFA